MHFISKFTRLASNIHRPHLWLFNRIFFDITVDSFADIIYVIKCEIQINFIIHNADVIKPFYRMEIYDFDIVKIKKKLNWLEQWTSKHDNLKGTIISWMQIGRLGRP